MHVAAAPKGQVPSCRQPQVEDIQASLSQSLLDCKGGSVYVSGVPGTGTSCNIDGGNGSNYTVISVEICKPS